MPFHNFRVMDNLNYVVLSILFANLMLPAWAQGIYVLEKDNKFFEVGQRKSFVNVDDDSCRQLRSLLKYGFINPNGEVVVPFRYDEAKSFSEGLAAVKVGSKWGFLDKKGRIVIEPKFDSVDFFREGLAAVRVKQQFGFIDMRGNFVVKPQFDCALHFSCG
ncbi:MAG: WG repeat-containing protein [Candidatus Obscuribacterales bacterium]|nr:WG repeat-containing protein [Candidatus Obscuribacterales bacterium]